MFASSRVSAIYRLACPIVIAQLGSILQGWADTIMVGQYGTPELSAAGFVNNVYNFIIYFLLGMSYATTPVVGAHFSRGSYGKVLQTLRDSNVVNVLTSLGVVALLLLMYVNMDSLGQPVELMPLIRPYFLVLMVSMPFLALFNSMKQFSDAVGDTKTPMWVMIGSNVLNLVLNYLFIFVLDGGLLGAGLATMVARMAMALSMYVALRRGSLLRSMRVKAEGGPLLTSPLRGGTPSGGQRGGLLLLRLGMPISIQMCLEAGSFNVCAIFMGWIGATALAAHQVMGTVSTLCFMVYYGIGAAAAIRIAYFRGQEEWDEVVKTARTALWMSLASGVVITTLIVVAGGPIAGLFTTSREVALLFLAMLPPFVCYQLGDCLQITYANALRAIQDVKAMMLFAFVAYCLISIPLGYVLAFPCGMGAVGIWWSFPFGLTTAGLLYRWRFLRITKSERFKSELRNPKSELRNHPDGLSDFGFRNSEFLNS
ncbi:MAG: MATE family efflux transporter [Bacteroidaceae bacterium]|nr:MATE family efflux transporter [Bacteroidaceae bacterium]